MDEATELRAIITGGPAEGTRSYKWEVEAGDEWHSYESAATFKFLADQPESCTFRVTVSYDNGETATSDPLTVGWTEVQTSPNKVNDGPSAEIHHLNRTVNLIP